MLNLSNKTVLITGASSGIGAACAEVFAKKKANLILFARRIEKLRRIAQTLEDKFGIKVITKAVDVRNQDEIKAAVDSLDSNWREIDVLVNNAGLARGLHKIHESDTADWDEMIDTNVKGLLYMTRAILPRMVENNVGHVINIGSIAGHETYPCGAVYCATKHAVNAITKGIKHDLLGTNVRVSSVDPGWVKTEFSLVRFKGDRDRAENLYKDMTPLSPEDIAETVLFCATRPAHVNISEVIMWPVDQASATHIYRHK